MADQELALEQAWSLCLGFVPAMVAKAVCELGVPDILAAAQANDHPPECAPSALSALQIIQRFERKIERPPREAAEQLDRLMRCLCAYGVFKASRPDDGKNENNHVNGNGEWVNYELTPVSRCLTGGASLRDFLLFETSSTMLRPWEYLSGSVLDGTAPFTAAHAMDVWELTAAEAPVNQLFNAGMSSASDVALLALLDHYPGLRNVETLVDVGGGIGTVASRIVGRHPTIKAISFDLPHVVATAPTYPGVQHIGGDMFQAVPKGDAIFLKWILHDWDDENSIKILKNCHKVLPKDGKIIIMDAVLDTTFAKEPSFNNVRTALDIVMVAHTNGGKERTKQQWEYILDVANFRLNKIYNLPCPQCVIEAFPY